MKKILPMFLIPLLLGCTKAKRSSNEEMGSTAIFDYSDVAHLTIEWDKILSQEEKHYFAYIYSNQCGHCKEIKQDVISCALNGDKKIYFIAYTKEIPIITNAMNNIGVDNYEQLGIIGTPTLFEINEGIVVECYTGSSSIIETLTNQ